MEPFDMQPLNRVTPNPGKITFGHECLLRHADLAALAMTVISIWSRIDAQTASLFAYSIGKKQIYAAKLLNSVESASAKSALVRTAIAETLGEDELLLFNSIMKTGSGSLGARNDFAHGVWGECENPTDALLLVDSKYYVEHGAGIFDDLNRWLDTNAGQEVTHETRVDIRSLDVGNVYVYRKTDFERLIREADRLHRALKHFQRLFPALGATSIETIRKTLDAEHLIPPKLQDQPDAPSQ